MISDRIADFSPLSHRGKPQKLIDSLLDESILLATHTAEPWTYYCAVYSIQGHQLARFLVYLG